MICPALSSLVGAEACAFRGRADGNVAAVSHGQHVPTPNTAVSKAVW